MSLVSYANLPFNNKQAHADWNQCMHTLYKTYFENQEQVPG